MGTRTMTNETWNSEGKLIFREIIEITEYEDGTIEEKVIKSENF